MRSGGAHQHDRVQKEEIYLVYFYLSKTFSPHAVGIVSGMYHVLYTFNIYDWNNDPSNRRVAYTSHSKDTFDSIEPHFVIISFMEENHKHENVRFYN